MTYCTITYNNICLFQYVNISIQNCKDEFSATYPVCHVPLEKLQGKFSVYVLCNALGVPSGTFYNQIKRNKHDNISYSNRREELSAQIRQIYDKNHHIYGSDKIIAILQQEE